MSLVRRSDACCKQPRQRSQVLPAGAPRSFPHRRAPLCQPGHRGRPTDGRRAICPAESVHAFPSGRHGYVRCLGAIETRHGPKFAFCGPNRQLRRMGGRTARPVAGRWRSRRREERSVRMSNPLKFGVANPVKIMIDLGEDQDAWLERRLRRLGGAPSTSFPRIESYHAARSSL